MEANGMTGRFAFKSVDGCVCLAWPMPPANGMVTPPDATRESAFADFPNIITPTQLVDVYERLVYSPVNPRYVNQYMKVRVEDIENPETLLEAFGLASTRKNMNEARNLLISSSIYSDAWGILPLSDCLTMSRDMKALLTVLAFSYGLCSGRALELNASHDFAFTYEFRGKSTPYGEFILQVREDDPNELEVDHTLIHENIQRAVQSKDGKPGKRVLESMRQFAESYINGFMRSVHPVLWDGTFASMSRNGGLSDMYAYWAQRAAKGKILACANCGKLVASPRKNQMYCSQSCKVQASKKGFTKK